MTNLEAVIEIGSTGIRLLVAEIAENGSWSVIDRSERPIAIGRDVFTSGFVSRETLLQCLRILNRFKEQLAGWNVGGQVVTVIATSAIREAKNRDTVLDRIKVKTGFSVRVIDGIEENRLMYIAVLNSLKDEAPKLKRNNSIIMELGGGSTEIMLLAGGKMVAAHSMRLGTVIIEQNVKAMMGSQQDARRLLEEYVRNAGDTLNAELNLGEIRQVIAIGSEARVVARMIGRQISDRCWSMNRSDFDSLVETIQNYTVEECVARFKISYNDAQSMTISLLAYKLFIGLTSAEEIITPDTSIREGSIISKISEPNYELQEEFYTQVVASALNLGKKYHFDEEHADYVRTIALQLFDKLQNELGLDRHARLLLEVTSLLHDVGVFIRSTDHHLHSQYIILHSEIFGLNKDDMIVVANTARYHRGPMPINADPALYALPRSERTTVLKLASVIRIADALDRGHSQRTKEFTIDINNDTLFLRAKGTHTMTLEQLAVAEKSDLFQQIFGYKIILV